MDLGSGELRWIMNGDVQLALETLGSGPQRVLFIHGWISSRRMWYEVARVLPPSDYTIHLLDVRGCGQSDRPLSGHDLDGYVGDVEAALRTLSKDTILVGHSMGARIAQRVAVERPANLGGLVLVAPGTARGAVTVPRQRDLAMLAYGSRRRIASFQRGAMVASIAPEANLRLVEDALFAQREHWFGWYDHGRAGDFSSLLPQINVPTQVVAAERDPLVPIGRLEREVVADIAGAHMTVLQNCGHNIPVEVPRSVAEAIASLIASRKAS